MTGTGLYFCSALRNQVQSVGLRLMPAGPIASALHAPNAATSDLAFMFTALEPAVATAALNVTRSWTTGGVVFRAACQQTYSELFRGNVPPPNARISIACPKCMAFGVFINFLDMT